MVGGVGRNETLYVCVHATGSKGESSFLVGSEMCIRGGVPTVGKQWTARAAEAI